MIKYPMQFTVTRELTIFTDDEFKEFLKVSLINHLCSDDVNVEFKTDEYSQIKTDVPSQYTVEVQHDRLIHSSIFSHRDFILLKETGIDSYGPPADNLDKLKDPSRMENFVRMIVRNLNLKKSERV